MKSVFQGASLEYCRNPTNNPKQLKTTFVIIGKKTTPPLHHHHVITFKAGMGNLGSGFFVKQLFLTQLEEIWKTTSLFLKMEDDLKFVSKWNTTSILFKWKMTSILYNFNPTRTNMEDDIIYKWKTTLIFFKWKMTSIFLSMEKKTRLFSKNNNATKNN